MTDHCLQSWVTYTPREFVEARADAHADEVALVDSACSHPTIYRRTRLQNIYKTFELRKAKRTTNHNAIRRVCARNVSWQKSLKIQTCVSGRMNNTYSQTKIITQPKLLTIFTIMYTFIVKCDVHLICTDCYNEFSHGKNPITIHPHLQNNEHWWFCCSELTVIHRVMKHGTWSYLNAINLHMMWIRHAVTRISYDNFPCLLNRHVEETHTPISL